MPTEPIAALIRIADIARGSDIVCQGDRPDASVLVINGMLARYHTLSRGDRQYISLHIAGDLPDLQSLALGVMDHSMMAVDQAEIALFPHEQLRALLLDSPAAGYSLWRLTLIDAAIFREAITRNGLRGGVERLAHLFCEQFARAQAADIAEGNTCSLPLTQTQLGQMLGMSLVSVNRAMRTLRKDQSMELRGGKLVVLDWERLQSRAAFDPTYLHLGPGPPPPGSRRQQASR